MGTGNFLSQNPWILSSPGAFLLGTFVTSATYSFVIELFSFLPVSLSSSSTFLTIHHSYDKLLVCPILLLLLLLLLFLLLLLLLLLPLSF